MQIQNDRRLLLELDKHRRDINRMIINPEIDELNLDMLKPIVDMVARTRAAYIRELFTIARSANGQRPAPEQVETLRRLRLEYQELVDAANALETAIDRGYLEVMDANVEPAA